MKEWKGPVFLYTETKQNRAIMRGKKKKLFHKFEKRHVQKLSRSDGSSPQFVLNSYAWLMNDDN